MLPAGGTGKRYGRAGDTKQTEISLVSQEALGWEQTPGPVWGGEGDRGARRFPEESDV